MKLRYAAASSFGVLVLALACSGASFQSGGAGGDAGEPNGGNEAGGTSSMGGTSKGGSANEAGSHSAGSSNGGSSNGGSDVGGTDTGGVSSGGSMMGGSSSGGVVSGGSAMGGAATGGASMGGTATGGANMGGNNGGGGGNPDGCQSENDCVNCAYPKAPATSQDCYCANCATTPMLETTCKVNQTSWEKYCANVEMFCPLACVMPPPVTCKDHMCVAN